MVSHREPERQLLDILVDSAKLQADLTVALQGRIENCYAQLVAPVEAQLKKSLREMEAKAGEEGEGGADGAPGPEEEFTGRSGESSYTSSSGGDSTAGV